jgi:membrane-bound ClpP family serine protease
MYKIDTLLKGLIRRVKKHMTDIIVTTGIALVAVGFGFVTASGDLKILGVIFASTGLFVTIIGTIIKRFEDSEEKRIRHHLISTLDSIKTTLDKINNKIK